MAYGGVDPNAPISRPADVLQVVGHRNMREGIENVSLGAHRCALHLLPGVAQDEEQCGAWLIGGRDGGGASSDGERLGGGCVIGGRGRACVASAAAHRRAGGRSSGRSGRGRDDRCDVRCDQRLAFSESGCSNGGGAGGHRDLCHANPRHRLIQRRRGTAVRPARAEREVDAQPQLASLSLRVGHIVQHLRREERQVLQPLRRIVEHLGILEGQLGPLNAVGLHLLQFAQDLRLDDRKTEPPPANHGPRLVRRIGKSRAQGSDGGALASVTDAEGFCAAAGFAAVCAPHAGASTSANTMEVSREASSVRVAKVRVDCRSECWFMGSSKLAVGTVANWIVGSCAAGLDGETAAARREFRRDPLFTIAGGLVSAPAAEPR